jgi:hypothetical protein
MRSFLLFAASGELFARGEQLSVSNAAGSILPGIDGSREQPKIDWRTLPRVSDSASSKPQTDVARTWMSGARAIGQASRQQPHARSLSFLSTAASSFNSSGPVRSHVRPSSGGDLLPAADLEGTAGWLDIPPARRALLALDMLEALEARRGATAIVYRSPWFRAGEAEKHSRSGLFSHLGRAGFRRANAHDQSPGTPSDNTVKAEIAGGLPPARSA